MPKHPPEGWGVDTLSQFLEDAYTNRWATFANKRPWFKRLARLDGCFVSVEKDWTNPGNILTPLLFIRAHAAYRAGCEHAVAGQATEAFPEMRICLENAAYALHIHKNPSLAETWLRRHDNAIALKTVRDEFTVARLRATIAKANRHLATVFGELYDRTIDFGAHPNEKAVTSNLSVKGSGHERVYQQSYLHGDGLLLDNALKTAAQTGVRALEVLQEAFGPRFELLGVRAELLKLRRGL